MKILKGFGLIVLVLLVLIVLIGSCSDTEEEPVTEPEELVEEQEEIVEEDESENEINNQAEDENDLISYDTTGNLEVHFIDVDQGDSILIITPLKNILIDGGDRGATALNYIRNQGVESLDYIISTHPHADHIGGLVNVIQSMPVGEVIDPAVVHTTQTFEDYLTLIDQKGIRFTEGRAGMTFDMGGGAIMQILHPTASSQSDLNNASIVIRLTFGNVSFLFAGDAEGAAERQILNRGYDLNSTILKVGHHGSKTSSTQAFLNAVRPEVAIIMCGKNNSYGYPHEETLSKLNAVNAEIYRTDLQGNILLITDGQTYSMNKEPYAYAENQQPPPASEPVITTPMVIQGEYVGSKNSDKYHYPSCGSAKKILPENLVTFSSVADARSKGYVPCGTCKPPSN